MSDLTPIREAVLVAASQAPPSRSWTSQVLGLMGVYAAVGGASLMLAAWWLGHAPTSPGPIAPLLGFAGLLCLAAALAPPPWARWLNVAGLSAAGVSLSLHALHFGSWTGSSPWLGNADCALAELAIAAFPALTTVMASRHSAYRARGAVAGGLAAAITGVMVLDLTCPVEGIRHALSFHVAPAFAVVLLVWFVRARLSSWSHAP